MSRIYRKSLANTPIRLTQRVAQPLSAHVEAGRLDGEILHRDIEKILAPLRHKQAILLACTHYPAIEHQIRMHINKGCELLDPAEKMADTFAANWSGKPAVEPDIFYTTGNPVHFRKSAQKAFNVKISTISEIKL
jgi:glutamate racemase